MKELIIDKVFSSRQELEAFEHDLCEKYIVCMIFHKDQEFGKPDIYGIDKVLHFGERH